MLRFVFGGIVCFSLLLMLGACAGNQENRIIGTWMLTRMDELPSKTDGEVWEFTAENDLIKYQLKNNKDSLMNVGNWSFNKFNRLNITKFDKGFNGEWEVVNLNKNVLRIVLKIEADDHSAGQVLREFTRR